MAVASRDQKLGSKVGSNKKAVFSPKRGLSCARSTKVLMAHNPTINAKQYGSSLCFGIRADKLPSVHKKMIIPEWSANRTLQTWAGTMLLGVQQLLSPRWDVVRQLKAIEANLPTRPLFPSSELGFAPPSVSRQRILISPFIAWSRSFRTRLC
jgi:hypothetical protein